MRPTAAEQIQLDQVLSSVEASLAAVSLQVLSDGQVRDVYICEVERGIRDIRQRFEAGRFASVREAAEEANRFRNTALETMRARTSPLGLVIAKNLKEKGRTLNELIGKYTEELYGQGTHFHRLSQARQDKVYATIVERAMVTNGAVNRMLRRLAPAARGMVVISVAVTVYEVATAENKAVVVLREGAGLGAGFAGGVAGGAIAGLACGPGAPVCVTVGAFAGGALAAFGVQFAFGD